MKINAINNSHVYGTSSPNTINNAQAPGKPAKIEKTSSEDKNPDSVKKEISSRIISNHEGDLTKAEEILINELKQIDSAVRKHEMAHVSAGGRYILSGANFSYQTGPDGKRYVVGGEVKIDTSPIPGDPQATINKMRQIRNAALAPADPSSQDRKVASTAMTISTKAMSELMIERAKDKVDSDEEQAFGNIRQTADNAYIKVQTMPENQQESSFRISA